MWCCDSHWLGWKNDLASPRASSIQMQRTAGRIRALGTGLRSKGIIIPLSILTCEQPSPHLRHPSPARGTGAGGEGTTRCTCDEGISPVCTSHRDGYHGRTGSSNSNGSMTREPLQIRHRFFSVSSFTGRSDCSACDKPGSGTIGTPSCKRACSSRFVLPVA